VGGEERRVRESRERTACVGEERGVASDASEAGAAGKRAPRRRGREKNIEDGKNTAVRDAAVRDVRPPFAGGEGFTRAFSPPRRLGSQALRSDYGSLRDSVLNNEYDFGFGIVFGGAAEERRGRGRGRLGKDAPYCHGVGSRGIDRSRFVVPRVSSGRART